MATESQPLAADLIRAIELLDDVFTARSIRYALVGGVAIFMRGQPRFTQDVDLLLDVPQIALPGLLEELTERGFALQADKVIREYVRDNFTSFRYGSVPIDCIKPTVPLFSHAISEASLLLWTHGHSFRVARPESLILTKLVAFRSQDQADIETLLAANREEIDLAYIRSEWTALSMGEDARTAWLEAAIARCVPVAE